MCTSVYISIPFRTHYVYGFIISPYTCHFMQCHKEQTQNSVAVSNCMSVYLLAEQSGGFDHTMIVPVWVRPAGEPEKEIL